MQFRQGLLTGIGLGRLFGCRQSLEQLLVFEVLPGPFARLFTLAFTVIHLLAKLPYLGCVARGALENLSPSPQTAPFEVFAGGIHELSLASILERLEVLRFPHFLAERGGLRPMPPCGNGTLDIQVGFSQPPLSQVACGSLQVWLHKTLQEDLTPAVFANGLLVRDSKGFIEPVLPESVLGLFEAYLEIEVEHGNATVVMPSGGGKIPYGEPFLAGYPPAGVSLYFTRCPTEPGSHLVRGCYRQRRTLRSFFREVGVNAFHNGSLVRYFYRDEFDELCFPRKNPLRYREALFQLRDHPLGLGKLGFVDLKAAAGRLRLDEAELTFQRFDLTLQFDSRKSSFLELTERGVQGTLAIPQEVLFAFEQHFCSSKVLEPP